MINEKREIEELLRGKRFDKNSMYRSIYLLAQHYMHNGYDFLECRNKIFKWGKKYNVAIAENVNSIINRAYKEKKEIRGTCEIPITKKDIDLINSYAGYVPNMHRDKYKYNLRLSMFAFLVYSRMFQDENGLSEVSIVGMSNWVGIRRQDFHTRYLNKMIDIGFIEKIQRDNSFERLSTLRKKHKMITRNNYYRVATPKDSSENSLVLYLFSDSDLRLEFQEINDKNK